MRFHLEYRLYRDLACYYVPVVKLRLSTLLDGFGQLHTCFESFTKLSTAIVLSRFSNHPPLSGNAVSRPAN